MAKEINNLAPANASCDTLIHRPHCNARGLFLQHARERLENGVQCDELNNYTCINYFSTGNDCVSEDHFPFKNIKQTINLGMFLLK